MGSVNRRRVPRQPSRLHPAVVASSRRNIHSTILSPLSIRSILTTTLLLRDYTTTRSYSVAGASSQFRVTVARPRFECFATQGWWHGPAIDLAAILDSSPRPAPHTFYLVLSCLVLSCHRAQPIVPSISVMNP